MQKSCKNCLFWTRIVPINKNVEDIVPNDIFNCVSNLIAKGWTVQLHDKIADLINFKSLITRLGKCTNSKFIRFDDYVNEFKSEGNKGIEYGALYYSDCGDGNVTFKTEENFFCRHHCWSQTRKILISYIANEIFE